MLFSGIIKPLKQIDMESESKQLQGTKNQEFYVRDGSVYVLQLDSKDPELKITVSNKGPASEVKFYLGDRNGNRGNIFSVRQDDDVTFKLGSAGKGDSLYFESVGPQTAKIAVSW